MGEAMVSRCYAKIFAKQKLRSLQRCSSLWRIAKHGAAFLSREPYEPCIKYIAVTLSKKWSPSLAGAEAIVAVATTAREKALVL